VESIEVMVLRFLIAYWFQQVENFSSTATLEDLRSTMQNGHGKAHRRHSQNVCLWTLSEPLAVKLDSSCRIPGQAQRC